MAEVASPRQRFVSAANYDFARYQSVTNSDFNVRCKVEKKFSTIQ